MNCPNCSTLIPDDATFCPNCGTRPASGAAASTARAVPVAPVATAPSLPTFSGLETIAPMRESRGNTLEPGTRFADRYEIIRKIGEGGMGVVYMARDTSTEEEIVLKLVHPDLVTGEGAMAHLLSEGLIARQIRHPNIVAVYDVAQFEGQPYFTMEMVRGGTMRTWMVNSISTGHEISLDTAADVARRILAGLGEAHRMGIVHRDLKPENVLFVENPESGNMDLKILDFGIARAVGKPVGPRSGGAVGTPIYMAPEQMTAADAVGPSADLYSLSVMLYEMLMDAPPQARWEPVSAGRRDVPQAVDALLEKGLSARPRSRYQSAEEYSSALDAAVGKSGQKSLVDQIDISHQIESLSARVGDLKSWSNKKGMWGSASKKTKIWISAAAAVILLAWIGSMADQGGSPGGGANQSDNGFVQDNSPSGMQDGDQDNNPVSAPFNASGYWMDNYGNRFNVTHDGQRFTATGMIAGYGMATINGSLSQAGSQFTLQIPGAGQVNGTGQVWVDNAGYYHLRYALSDGTVGDFHINHSN